MQLLSSIRQLTHELAERLLTNPNDTDEILWFTFNGARYGYVYAIDSVVDYKLKRQEFGLASLAIMYALEALRVRIVC